MERRCDMGYGISVLVSGDRACFTRPEMKAERVSYDVITPSAARGILEAVYWKPAIKWLIDSVLVVNEIRFDTFRRNEVASKASYANAKKVACGSGKDLFISTTDDRQQRATTYLRDVEYVINAHFELTGKAGQDDTCEKHYNMMLRRLRKGQCFNQPYLGCREFSVKEIRLLEEEEKPLTSFYQGSDIDLGWMLYDLDFENGMEPQFFRAIMKSGVINVEASRKGLVG